MAFDVSSIFAEELKKVSKSDTGRTLREVDIDDLVRNEANFYAVDADNLEELKNSIALSINGCSTKSAGALTLVDGAFPAIAAEKNLAIRYKAKVSASEAVTNINAATVIFTIAAVSEKEAA